MTPNQNQRDELKAEIRKLLHNLTNCQQTVLGYFELSQYKKAYVACLECRAEYMIVGARLMQLSTLMGEEE